MYKEISSKEGGGDWFVLNKTEDIVPLTFTLLMFSFRYFKSDNQALQRKFFSFISQVKEKEAIII